MPAKEEGESVRINRALLETVRMIANREDRSIRATLEILVRMGIDLRGTL